MMAAAAAAGVGGVGGNFFSWRTPPCCRGGRIHKDSPWMTIDIPWVYDGGIVPRCAWASAWKPPFQTAGESVSTIYGLSSIKIHNGENMKMYRDILNHNFLVPNLLADVLL